MGICNEIKKHKEEAVRVAKSVFEAKANQGSGSVLDIAKGKEKRMNDMLTLASVIGPIIVSIVHFVFPITPSSSVWWYIVIDISALILLIITLGVLIWKKDVYQLVIGSLETNKADRQKRINSLEGKIDLLENGQSFYVSSTKLIGQAMKTGKKDIESLAKVLIAAIYHNLSRVTKGDDITINLYELRNERVKMISSMTRLQYCDRNSVNVPILFQSFEGVEIKDERIQDYYCIRCIRGKVKGIDGKYVISDWRQLAREFKWGGWSRKEMEAITKKRDREKCIELGFRYNQYFGFMIRRDDGTQIFFEIITNDETVIAPNNEIHTVTRRLRDLYSPLISILWDVSIISSERE